MSDEEPAASIEEMLEKEKSKAAKYEEKLKYALADFENLSKKAQSYIQDGINAKVDEFISEFIDIYDDFVRAKETFVKDDAQAQGLDSIVKKMDSILQKYDVLPIDAVGKSFDPNLHEAISVTSDPALDDDTITKEIRKGYISQKRVIRPTLVEISKKG